MSMAKPRRKESDSLRRRGPKRDPFPRILIVCEGAVTEKEYFCYLHHAERIPIVLEIEAGGDPKKLVERAKSLQREARDSGDPFDQVWCVFDIDDHKRIADAKQQARDNGIGLIVSNPCFDLWILLHYQDLTQHTHRHKVQSLCRKHIPGYVKSPPCDKLLQLFPEAEKRATALNKWHASRCTDGDNPSTNVHNLVAKIRSYHRY